MDWDMFRCFDSEPNSISANLEDGDLDVVGNDDLLVFLTAYDQHSIPLPKSSLSLGEIRPAKNTNTFEFQPFNFPRLSVTLVAFFT